MFRSWPQISRILLESGDKSSIETIALTIGERAESFSTVGKCWDDAKIIEVSAWLMLSLGSEWLQMPGELGLT